MHLDEMYPTMSGKEPVPMLARKPAPDPEPNAAAAEMYPTMQPENQPASVQPQEAPTPASDTQVSGMARTMFPDGEMPVPANIQQLRASDRGTLMYNNTDFYAGVGLKQRFLDSGEDPDTAAALAAETSRILRDLRFDSGGATQFVNLLGQYGDMPADEATRKAWLGETFKMMETNGWKPHDLALAKLLVQRDPRVAALLTSTGLGNHPIVVEHMVLTARRERIAGRL